jgi:hypothetical protein
MTNYQKRTIYISSGFFIFFIVLSLVTKEWGFFLWSLLPIFMVLMSAFFAKETKHIKNFNQKSADKDKFKSE